MELLDAKSLIRKFHGFFEEYKINDIRKAANEGQESLLVNFFDISEYDIELAEQLLSFPDDVIGLMEQTLKQFLDDEEDKTLRVRLTSLPVTEKLMIRNIRAEHLNKLVIIEGLVRRKTDVRPKLKLLEYLCTNPSCSFSEDKLRIPQNDEKPRTLKACPKCKSGVELLSKVLVDSQNLVLEEIPEQLDNSADQPKRINVILQDDLVSPFKDSRTNPGSRVFVVGMIREIPVKTRTGGDSTNYDLFIEGNYIELSEDEYSEIIISKEELEEIKELANRDDVVETLVANTAPSIYGYNRIKEAILLQLFGGAGGTKGDGIKTRGDIHMLLIGDPGAAKSQLLKSAVKIAPKSMFVSGKSATGAGLCVSPKSLVMSNPGGIENIETVVENRFDGNELLYRPGIWRKDEINDIKIQSLNSKCKLHARHPKSIWKLKAPEFMYKISLSSGKSIEITANTKLFVLNNGKLEWVSAKELDETMYASTPSKLIGGNKNYSLIDMIGNVNPHIYGLENEILEVLNILKKKYNSIKNIAKHYNINENNLYRNWINKTAKGTPKLDIIKKLFEDSGKKISEYPLKLSLYNGKYININGKLNNDILYLTGLIAGDGDIRKTGSTYSIRLSNKETKLINEFSKIIEQNFNLKTNLVSGNNIRPQSARTNSIILANILFELGLCISSKSNKMQMSDKLLHLQNELLSEYLAGLYDTDGSIYLKNDKNGSNLIEFSTCSQMLAKQLQLVLLRFEIYSTLRKRSPTTEKINGAYDRYVISITNLKDIKKFANNIKLRHHEKNEKLLKLLELNKKEHSNYDILPHISKRLAIQLKKDKISLKNVGYHDNLSKKSLKIILEKIEKHGVSLKEYNEFEIIANSDIIFDKIKNINKIKCQYEFVYDFTVEDSHNFVVDGIFVHNTATVIKDEMTKGWALEAGAIVLANGGLCAIDELDKMSDEDTSAMHEALEQQTISIAKANIRATLRCQTTVLGAANPKFGRFDPYGDISKQINFPPALISRFDLIFILRDIPDLKRDDLIADHILQTHKDKTKTITKITQDFLKKYIAYAKGISPVLTQPAIEKIKNFYVSIRNASSEEEGGGVKSVPITARQLEAIVRLAEAYAKIKLDKKVKEEYAQKAIDLLLYCLQKIGIDPKTGQMDIDRITTGVTASTRNQYKTIQQIIDRLETEKPEINFDDIMELAEKQNIKRGDVQKVLDKLKDEGIIFEPRKNIYKKLS